MERPGLVLLGVLVPLQFPLFLTPLGPYGAWALVALALWLCRREPDLAPRVPWAFAAFAGAVVLALGGSGVTVGTSAGPLFDAGSDDTVALGAVGAFGVAIAPAAVLLAGTREGTVRGLAKTGGVLLGLALLAAVGTTWENLGRPDGQPMAPMSGALFLLILAHIFVLLAFLLPPARGAWARVRGGAAEA